MRIVDAQGRAARERVEGRVQFRGPSVTAGYFRNQEATHAVLQDGWMDSGDLGYLAGGELFVDRDRDPEGRPPHRGANRSLPERG